MCKVSYRSLVGLGVGSMKAPNGYIDMEGVKKLIKKTEMSNISLHQFLLQRWSYGIVDYLRVNL